MHLVRNVVQFTGGRVSLRSNRCGSTPLETDRQQIPASSISVGMVYVLTTVSSLNADLRWPRGPREVPSTMDHDSTILLVVIIRGQNLHAELLTMFCTFK